MSKKPLIGLLTIFTIGLLILPARAEKGDYLFGDWGGKRSSFEEKGLSFEFVYTGDMVFNTSGGIKTGGIYLANIDMTMTLDTELTGWWKGGTFFVYILNNHGGKPSEEYIGDLQTIDNIEATETTRLYEIWYEQRFHDDTFSLLLGQHDLNSEFNVTEYGGLFIDSSFGIQPDISSNVPVSIFPVAAPAIRLKWNPTDAFYFMAAVYDGAPGDPKVNNTGTEWKLSSDEGAMTIYEAGYLLGEGEGGTKLPGTYKLGAWYHTGDFDDQIDANAPKHSGNHGVYFLADQMVYRESGDQGLGLFLQIGGAPDDRNEIDSYIGGGIHYRGLIPGRNEDDLGIAVAHASISDKLRSAGARDSAETTLELTYHTQITPWFAIQPDIQFVFNPGADSLNDAVVALARFEISL